MTQIDDPGLVARLERIQRLTEELARVQGESIEVQRLAEHIRRELHAAREALRISRT